MRSYEALLLDLFDTLVDLKVERLPLITYQGVTRHSTGMAVYQCFQRDFGQYDFDRFYHAFARTYREVDDRRNQTHREIQSHERFATVLAQLGIHDPPQDAVERLVAVHMDQLFDVMAFPPGRREILQQLKDRFRLGLVSNFDHPPTAHRILSHFDLSRFFETIVISGDIGWRKPNSRIFQAALEPMHISPKEALFVGDTPSADIIGAKQFGMDVVWIDHRSEALDPSWPQPDYIIGDFEELASLPLSD